MINRSEAIKAFLTHSTFNDLSSLYNLSMECQVNVAQDGGERIEGEYQGRQWNGWTDGMQTWKSFRIPHNANTDPTYNDTHMTYDLGLHAEGIGLTGWNWEKRVSQWVAFDFDAISGHSDKHQLKLTPDNLSEVQQVASQISWVTIRKSTSGKGLHLYVFLDNIPTENHNEHAALARAILSKMAALTGFEFSSKVDICGGNMWIWHRKMKNTDGLSLIKQGDTLSSSEIPSNWKDHVKVVSGRRKKILPGFVEESAQSDADKIFEELTGCRTHTTLDEDHKKLIKYLEERRCQAWWSADHHMLVAHTYDLKCAHAELNLRGNYDTLSTGREKGIDHNCFLFPTRKGSWVVRRFSPGVKEHPTWEQDGNGWTRSYFNREPTLSSAAHSFEGVEDEKGAYNFNDAESAAKAAQQLGVDLGLKPYMALRPTKLKEHKDGRVIVEIKAEDSDSTSDMRGWLKKKGNTWQKIFSANVTQPTENDIGNYDDLVRHVVDANNQDAGWMIFSDGSWHLEPLTHINNALYALGMDIDESRKITGASVIRPWRLVNQPFQLEYPGSRLWNRDAAQLRFTPSVDIDNLKYDTWLKILNHCGKGLDYAVLKNEWCRSNGIKTGGDYLKCWIASLFKEPTQPLPYLFFWGSQNCGKTSFHDAISLLITKGYCRAENSLKNQNDFNAELEHAVLCVIEEISFKSNKMAYERIKDWVTSRLLPIHRKTKTPYHVVNSTHWVQCANNAEHCPVFPGDTRITMIHVPDLDPLEMIPRKQLIPLLEKEACDFLSAIFHLELPPSPDRLNVPIIETDEKSRAMELNKNVLEQFIDDNCYVVPGKMILFSDFFERFMTCIDPTEIGKWSKIKVGRELPLKIQAGRNPKDNQKMIINLSFEPPKAEESLKLLRVENGVIKNDTP